MTMALVKSCGETKSAEFSCPCREKSQEIGRGVRLFSGQKGEVWACKSQSSIEYISIVRIKDCQIEVHCEGDSSQASRVQKICDEMVSSLEISLEVFK